MEIKSKSQLRRLKVQCPEKLDRPDFEKAGFPGCIADDRDTLSLSVKDANKAFDDWLSTQQEIYLDETYWSTSNDEAFKSRACRKGRLVCQEKCE